MNVKFSQNYILHMKFLEFSRYNHNSCEIWHSFSRTSRRNFFRCHYSWFITSLALEKCKKEGNILQIILVQDLCPVKIKITQFRGGLRLIRQVKTCKHPPMIPITLHIQKENPIIVLLFIQNLPKLFGDFLQFFHQVLDSFKILWTDAFFVLRYKKLFKCKVLFLVYFL